MKQVKNISYYIWRILLVSGVTVCGLLLVSAVKTKDAKPCSAVAVHYKKARQSGFVTKEEIMSTIAARVEGQPVGTPLHKFDLKEIEQSIESHAWVLDAQLYFDNNQVLHITIDEPLPVARVIDVRGRHFYLDADGMEMPVSKLHRVELPVVTGAPVRRDSGSGKEIILRVAALAEVMAIDPFWMAQAAQVDIQPNGRVEMVPVFGNHIVDLGYGDKPAAMLGRLKQFYMAIAPTGHLDSYKRISAAYEGQIVAQRSDDAISKEDRAAVMQSYKKMVQNNQQAVDSASVTSSKGVGRLVSTDAPEPPAPKKQTVIKEDKSTGATELPAPQEAKDKPAPAEKEKEKESTTDKAAPSKQEKVPKAIMPKIENN